MFYVHVNEKRSRYRGIGENRKLLVNISKETVNRLQRLGVPAYVVGIDIDSKEGNVKAITPGMVRGFSGIATTYRLDCVAILALWNEVDAYWPTPTHRVLDTRFT
jgi:hypothetical protein